MSQLDGLIVQETMKRDAAEAQAAHLAAARSALAGLFRLWALGLGLWAFGLGFRV
jgi:hypothetical protein